MTANPSSEFGAWLATMGVPKEWGEDARDWLQRLFDQSGPVSAEGGRAVWWWRPGDHSVAEIGALGTLDS